MFKKFKKYNYKKNFNYKKPRISRVKFNRKYKIYKAKLFKRLRRFNRLHKQFSKRFLLSQRKRAYRLDKKVYSLFSYWDSKLYFTRLKRRRKRTYRLKKLRSKFYYLTRWTNRIKFGYFKRTPKLYASSKFKYLLLDDFRNKKKFKIWLKRRFSNKKRQFVFRIFYFFRKLEKSKINLKARSFLKSKKQINPLFFEKYRKFSLWSLKYSWKKFAKTFKKIKKKIKKKKIKKKKKKKSKKKFKKNKLKSKKKFKKKRVKYRRILTRKLFRFKFGRRRFQLASRYKILNRTARFLRFAELVLKYPHNKRNHKLYFTKNLRRFSSFNFFNLPIKSTIFTSYNSYLYNNLFSYSGTVLNRKRVRFTKAYRKTVLNIFNTKARFPKVYYKLFLTQAKVPLSYFFSRSSKKINVFFKTFRRKNLVFKRLYGKLFSRQRLIARKINFMVTKVKKPRFSRKINRKIFFNRKIFAKFYPFLGYFSKFGRTIYKFKSKRLKFFRFFKKYFLRFHRFSAIKTLKSKQFIKKSKNIKFFIHIFRSVNNLFVNISAPRGRSLYIYSAGRTNFRGSKRLSPIAIETMGKTVSNLLKNTSISSTGVVFHTPVDYLVRALLRGLKLNINFSSFRYCISKPHNGLRRRATRRI